MFIKFQCWYSCQMWWYTIIFLFITLWWWGYAHHIVTMRLCSPYDHMAIFIRMWQWGYVYDIVILGKWSSHCDVTKFGMWHYHSHHIVTIWLCLSQCDMTIGICPWHCDIIMGICSWPYDPREIIITLWHYYVCHVTLPCLSHCDNMAMLTKLRQQSYAHHIEMIGKCSSHCDGVVFIMLQWWGYTRHIVMISLCL